MRANTRRSGMVNPQHMPLSGSDGYTSPRAREEQKLPQQLSPATLAILLEDLIEYNGISYRNVPLRTFRGKYIGLYFGAIENPRCEGFLEHLRGFYIVMNHKFECVLVSSDGTDDAYTRHTQMTSWPSYPRGDLRTALLRQHFNITECPTLVIVDANGIVVTANGVEKIVEDQAGFPWTEKVIDTVYGENSAGPGLRSVLSALDLPPSDFVPAMQHQVIGLLFGELWCPDTREIMKRLDFLLLHYRGRLGKHSKAVDTHFAVYYVHCDELEKYSSFLNFQVPFPTVHIQDEHLRQVTHHFLNVREHPKFCIVSPKDGWVVEDGATWIKRDPTGVCFPWQPNHASSSGSADGFLNSLAVLTEEELSAALTRGPVFIAFLHDVHSQRTEAIATLRAASTGYVSRVNDRQRIIKEQKLDLMGTLGADKDEDGQPSLFESLRKDLSRPTRPLASREGGLAPPENNRGSLFGKAPSTSPRGTLNNGAQGKVLWKVLQKAVEKQTSLHGSAPWNNPGVGPYTANRSSMTFFYSGMEDVTTSVLKKFCGCDIKHLQQHQMWRRVQAQIEAKEAQSRTEMLQQFRQVTADAASLGGAPQQSGDGTEPQRRESALPSVVGPDGAPLVLGSAASGDLNSDPLAMMVPDDEEHHDDKHDSTTTTSSFTPKAKFGAINKMTEELLGEDHSNSGTGMIIDLLQGVYYICGNLVEKDAVVRFLDAWDQGSLDPFEMRLPNQEEMIKDDEEQAVAREMAMYSQQALASGMLPDPTMSVIPGIVIWIPSRQHSESHMGPDSIFRALLNLAFQRSPREDKVNTYQMFGGGIDPEDEETGTGMQKRLTPWIEKLWIFGLLDTPEAGEEQESGAWQPPHAHFLAELYSYVDDLVKTRGGDAEQEDMSQQTSAGRRGSRFGRKVQRQWPPQSADEMLSPPTDLFDDGLRELRATFMDSHAIAGNHNVCMRTARTRRTLHASMLDELGYHSLVQYLPPPLFVLLVGDLPPVDLLPWPTVLQVTHMHVLGSVPSVCQYRDVCPTLTVQSWNSWAESTADDRISTNIARHIAVPWA